MKFYIKHETRGRLRIHLAQKRMSYGQADTLLYYLENLDEVASDKVYERTCDAVVNYRGSRAAVIRGISEFHYQDVEVPSQVLQSSGRALNAEYQEKLISKVICHYGRRLFLPYPLNAIYTTATSLKYIWKGIDTLLHRKIEVPVLDATAIGVSVFRQDFGTAGSIMFLLGIGELLEEWTHKKSVDDLARTMSLNTGKVWLRSEGTEVLVDADKIQAGDMVVVHMGNVIPFDGLIAEGEAMVIQASLTGDSVPVRKVEGNSVYAGTVVEEGEAVFTEKAVGGSSSYEKIFYFNPEFDSLPKQIKEELQIMCVLFTEDVGGILRLEFDETGNLNLTVESKEDDFFFDEIGSVLKIKQLRAEKRELLENMETYFRVFFLQEGQDVTGN